MYNCKQVISAASVFSVSDAGTEGIERVIRQMVLMIILSLLFGSTQIDLILFQLLAGIGQCAILKKCGEVHYWKGIIPVYGDYLMARCGIHEA